MLNTTKIFSLRSLGLAVIAIFPLLAETGSVANAEIIYETSFSSADGHTVEGAAITGIDGWSAQTQLTADNVGTNGELRGANFVRGINAPVVFDVGDVLALTASVKSITGGNPGFDANILQFGITGETNLGTLANRAGVLLGGNGSVFRLASQSNTGRVDSIAIDTQFHTLNTTITKSAILNQFDVVSNFGGGPNLSYTVTNAALYSAGTVRTVINTQGQTNVGGIAIDSLSVDFTDISAVPEPGAFGFVALAGIAGLVRRRRTIA